MCLNFGLGIAHIPNTPITINDAQESMQWTCFQNFTSDGLLVRSVNNSTGVDVVTWAPSANTENTLADFDLISTNATGLFDPITQALEGSYQAIVTAKNLLLGGFVTNVIESMTLVCDFDPESATFGQPIQTEVMTYFIAGINLIFGLMLFLAILYIITGKSFGI